MLDEGLLCGAVWGAEAGEGLCQPNLGGTGVDRRMEHMGGSLSLAGGCTAELLGSVMGLVQMQAAVLRLALGVSGSAVAQIMPAAAGDLHGL